MIFNPPTLTIDSVGKLSNVPDILVADVMQPLLWQTQNMLKLRNVVLLPHKIFQDN